MYLDCIREGYLPAIAALEEEVYPEEMVFGLGGLKEFEQNRNELQAVWAVFTKGELQGCIMSYTESEHIRDIYISNLACKT